MGFLDRSRSGLPTSSADPDIGELIEAMERAEILCDRFNSGGSDRRALLEELFGEELDPGTTVRPSFRCDVGTNIHLGRSVMVNYDCVLLDTADIRIGDHTLIAPRTVIATSSHDFPAMQRRDVRTLSLPVHIGSDVWIGASSVILPGITVGDGAIVGAGSIVTHDVPAGEVWAGNPARRIRRCCRCASAWRL